MMTMDMDLTDSRTEQDEPVRDELMNDLEDNDGNMEQYNGEMVLNKDREKSRESGKHRSKDRKKGRREEKDRASKDIERSKERERDDYTNKDLDRYDGRERDRLESTRERRKEDRSEYEKDRDRGKEKSSRDKAREKDYGRDKCRDKERDPEQGNDRGKECNMDREPDRERERARDHKKDRDREYERGKEREKAHDHSRDQDKVHERDRDRDRGHNRSKARERDHEIVLEKEVDREKGKEKDHDKGKDREKDRDRTKDREREKEKTKDREREKERDKQERQVDRDKSRARSRERESAKGRVGEKDERVKLDGRESRTSEKKGEDDQDEGATHGRAGSKDHSEKPMASQLTSELEDRLIKMKEERLKKKYEGASEILSWVGKSRSLEEKKSAEMEKAARLSKALEEQDNILAESEDEGEATQHLAKNLAGVKILHGLNKVIEGGAVVLTLKDQNILADGDVNEEVDMLENVEIGEQKQRDDAYKAAKKKTGTYVDKFTDDMSSRKTILPQYDDPIEDEVVTLDESGHFSGEAEKKLEELRRRIEGGSTGKPHEDLTSSGKVLSDYYTSDEMLQFNKPKKRKSLRKKEKLDLDALEAEAISAGLGVGDLGSRKDLKKLAAKEEQERTDAEMRSKAYLTAYAKAEEASKVLRQEQTLIFKDDGHVFGEDYEDLQRSLEQARKLALKRQDEPIASGPQAVALLAIVNKEQRDTQSPIAGEPQENKVVITEMEEFVLGLQLNEETHRPESEDVFMDEDVPKSYEQDTKVEAGGWAEVKEAIKDEFPIHEEKEDMTPDEIIHEVPVGKGLAGAFKLLKERGTLNEGIDWGGRNMDKKKSKLVGIYDNDGGIHDKDGKKDINDEYARKEIRIERTDEFGRIMTPKEAFRVISHRFHGKGPGKMKQEKRMKQYHEDLKMKQMKASDTPSQAMERMREAQARLKTPYLVLSGHVKPGQTSDPRSGFATVEKDLGSLTPMLGDKKVEHFLGINSRPDSGSMGPPPSKKMKI